MTNPIGSTHTSHVQQTSAPARPQVTQQPQKSSAQPQDTVTLKSTGDVDHDGNSK